MHQKGNFTNNVWCTEKSRRVFKLAVAYEFHTIVSTFLRQSALVWRPKINGCHCFSLKTSNSPESNVFILWNRPQVFSWSFGALDVWLSTVHAYTPKKKYKLNKKAFMHYCKLKSINHINIQLYLKLILFGSVFICKEICDGTILKLHSAIKPFNACSEQQIKQTLAVSHYWRPELLRNQRPVSDSRANSSQKGGKVCSSPSWRAVSGRLLLVLVEIICKEGATPKNIALLTCRLPRWPIVCMKYADLSAKVSVAKL